MLTMCEIESYIEQDLRSCDDLRFLFDKYIKKAKAIYIGRNRCVFDMGSYVVKLPISYDGLGDNEWEGSISNNPNNTDIFYVEQYARTRLHYFKEVPVLFMEKVIELTYDEIEHQFNMLPDWVHSIDCGQVGVNAKGKLVAFDYGVN